jgi:hypothetical protein
LASNPSAALASNPSGNVAGASSNAGLACQTLGSAKGHVVEFCEHCMKRLEFEGLNHAYRCEVCHYVCHKNCRNNVNINCLNTGRLGDDDKNDEVS